MPGPAEHDPLGSKNAIIRGIYGALGIISVMMVLGLMLLTCVDVIGRYFLGTPVPGAFEITEVMLVALVFAALPLTTARGEHVEVDLLALLCPAQINRLLQIFAALFSAALLATFSWRLFVHALNASHDGAVSNALAIPLAPFGYLAALACALSALAALGMIARFLTRKDPQ